MGKRKIISKSQYDPEDKRWFGVEMEESDFEYIKPSILNRLGRVEIRMRGDLAKKGKVHADLYVNQSEIDIIYEIIDDKLCQRR